MANGHGQMQLPCSIAMNIMTCNMTIAWNAHVCMYAVKHDTIIRGPLALSPTACSEQRTNLRSIGLGATLIFLCRENLFVKPEGMLNSNLETTFTSRSIRNYLLCKHFLGCPTFAGGELLITTSTGSLRSAHFDRTAPFE